MATEGLALGTIGQITLAVGDVPRAVAFYRDALGIRQLPIPAPPSMAFFDCGGIRLMLSLPEGAGPGTGGGAIYFRVADIRRVYAGLKERGVVFQDEPHLIAKLPDHELWMTFFRDPSGNLLALMSEQKS
jgi:catechol 2,3-dioxygenase-like lactoylglutathione lyase family enzyme